jgi:Ca2+-binding EF-hand superfamily protein
MLAGPMFSQADQDGDKKLTKEELAHLADAWFDKLDTGGKGKLSQEQFTEKLGDVLPAQPGFGPGGGGQRGGGDRPGGGRGFGPARLVGPGLFTAADADKDGSLTRTELKGTFAKWFTDWDAEKSGSLTEDKLREGLNAALPRPNFGGRGFGGEGFGGQGGPGGPGGRGGFGPATMLAGPMFSQADQDGDKKLTKDELTTLADAWFDKLDTGGKGKLSQEQFTEKLGDVLPAQPGFGAGGGGQRGGGDRPGGERPGGGRGFGPARLLGPGLFTAADTDKDGSLTRTELKGTFAKWFTDWDADKSGSLTEHKLREGLNAALPRPNFGGPNFFAEEGPGGPGGSGPAPKPLTPEQVGLVRAWIDQGAE